MRTYFWAGLIIGMCLSGVIIVGAVRMLVPGAVSIQSPDNNAALRGLSTVGSIRVTRLGFAVRGDGPAVDYVGSDAACSLNGGSGDGGSQVPSANGKCWVASLPASADVRIWGVDMSGTSDSTAALEAAINIGVAVHAPCGTIRAVSTVNVTAPNASFRANRACTILKYDAAPGSPVAPVVDIHPTAAGATFADITVDAQADTKKFADPTIYGGNLIVGSAILIQADNARVHDVIARNSWDNCIAVARINKTTDVADAGFPRFYSVRGVRTSNCGQRGMGAGIDIGSGSLGVVDDHVDDGSYDGFILDIGAGAQGAFSNISVWGTKLNASVSRSYGVYIGSPDSLFSNITVIDAADRGVWVDGYAERTIINGLKIKATGSEALYLKAANTTITGLDIDSPGYRKPSGTVDAIVVDSSALPTVNLNLVGLNIFSSFNKARYGVVAIGDRPISGSIVNANLSGAVTPTHNLPGTFGIADNSLAQAWTTYPATATCSVGSMASPYAATVQGAYRKTGKTVDVRVRAVFGNAANCGGGVSISLPFRSQTRTIANGSETALFGFGLTGTIFEGTSAIAVKKYDGSSAVGTGHALDLRAQYEIE